MLLYISKILCPIYLTNFAVIVSSIAAIFVCSKRKAAPSPLLETPQELVGQNSLKGKQDKDGNMLLTPVGSPMVSGNKTPTGLSPNVQLDFSVGTPLPHIPLADIPDEADHTLLDIESIQSEKTMLKMKDEKLKSRKNQKKKRDKSKRE